MAAAKKNVAAPLSATFTRGQAVRSKRYRACRDVLGVALKEGETYTIEEIEKMKDEFLNRPIEEKVNGKKE